MGGVVVYGGSGSGGVGSDVVLSDLSDERRTDEDVVNQFLASPIDAAEALLGRDAWGQIPQPLRVTFVGAAKPGGTDLGAGWSVEDLRGGGLDLVVEVAEHHHRRLVVVVVVVQEGGGSGADGDSFGGSAIKRVGTECPQPG